MNNSAIAILALLLILNGNPMSAQELPGTSIQCGFKTDKHKNVSLLLLNSTDEDQQLVSNVSRVMKDTIFGFPRRVAIQFRDARRQPVVHLVADPEGWIYPVIYSSIMTKPDQNGLEIISLKPNQELEIKINVNQAIRRCLANGAEVKGADAKQFRIRIPILIENRRGETKESVIISEWIELDPEI